MVQTLRVMPFMQTAIARCPFTAVEWLMQQEMRYRTNNISQDETRSLRFVFRGIGE